VRLAHPHQLVVLGLLAHEAVYRSQEMRHGFEMVGALVRRPAQDRWEADHFRILICTLPRHVRIEVLNH
jgi:hypothetical protein